MIFRDRFHAGQLLAERLAHFAKERDIVVGALPRGGVLVAYPVAEALHAPLEVVLVRKLGVPTQPEVAMGAIGVGGVCILAHDLIRRAGISTSQIEEVIERERRELDRRQAVFRGSAPPLELRGRTVILVDDGIATGATISAACALVRRQRPRRLVIAVPVAPPALSEELTAQADEFLCLSQPEPFYATGQFYEDFHEVSDDEVRELLWRAAKRFAAQASPRATPA